MDVYYYVQSQLCITSGSKDSRGVQSCTPLGIECVQTPSRIGFIGDLHTAISNYQNPIFPNFRLYFEL